MQPACWLGPEGPGRTGSAGAVAGRGHESPRHLPGKPPCRRVLTICTHSMRGSRTDWFPERLTTQAGVSGVASSRAITASMPILLL